MRLRTARSAFLAPNARAISRVLTLPVRSRMKARSSSREGSWLRFMARSSAVSWPGARRVGLLGSLRGLALRSFAGGSPLGSSGRPFAGSGRLRRCGWWVAFGLARPRVLGGHVALNPGVEQSNRFVERDGFRRLIFRQCRVDAGVAHIRTVAPVLGNDRSACGRMIAQGTPWIGAEAAGARALGDFLCDECHCAVETNREYLIAFIQVSVGLAVLHVGAEPADGSADRFAILGV